MYEVAFLDNARKVIENRSIALARDGPLNRDARLTPIHGRIQRARYYGHCT